MLFDLITSGSFVARKTQKGKARRRLTSPVQVELLEQRALLSGVAAVSDTFSMIHDHTLGDNVGSNDHGGDVFWTFSIVSEPIHGTLMLDEYLGDFTYSPEPGYVGSDTFIYELSDGTDSDQATVTIQVTNAPPEASSQEVEVLHDHNYSGNLDAVDPDGDMLTFSLSTNPNNGSVIIDPSGSFTYTPNQLFVGSDAFSFEVFDGVDTDIAFIYIEVTNEAPKAKDYQPPDTHFWVLHDHDLSGHVEATDPDGDMLTFSVGTQANFGSVQMNGMGQFIYTPDVSFVGWDSFT